MTQKPMSQSQQILTLLNERGPMNVAQIAEALSLSSTRVRTRVYELRQEGKVRRDDEGNCHAVVLPGKRAPLPAFPAMDVGGPQTGRRPLREPLSGGLDGPMPLPKSRRWRLYLAVLTIPLMVAGLLVYVAVHFILKAW